MSFLTRSVLIVATTALGGCAIHHFDSDTGTEHVWGFGHMKMKVGVPNEGVRVAIRATDTFGLSAGLGDGDGAAVLGYHSLRHLKVVHENASVRLEWPNSDLFNIRVGSEPALPREVKITETVPDSDR